MRLTERYALRIANCSALVFAIARPDTFIWIGIEIVAMRLYSNSVLALYVSASSTRRFSLHANPRRLFSSRSQPELKEISQGTCWLE
ncbi:hypothetical protein BD310DRAFT_942837 [Dichomitus squalens]|uniref:Uncharacterized protein n=1 Tax=Dichomitus squalens TaxID=114155 RepID=A0A4Q9P9E8_9APHY|nr:hypothetical protein BD310DRAFT_942837 [Dichomitus squalens]